MSPEELPTPQNNEPGPDLLMEVLRRAGEQDLFSLLESCRLAGQDRDKDHPNYAGFLTNLATIYKDLGHLGQAESLLIEALETYRRRLGEGHADVGRALGRLAALYTEMGQLRRALPLQFQSFNVMAAALGDDHLEVATATHDVASLAAHAGDFENAENLYWATLKTRWTVLGEHHLDSIKTSLSLIWLYLHKGEYFMAMHFMEKVFPSCLKLSDEKAPQPSNAHMLHNIGQCLSELGQFDIAEHFFSKASEICRSFKGEEAPRYSSCLESQARVYVALGRLEEALTLMRRVAAIDARTVGQVFTFGSERQRQEFLADVVEDHLDTFLSLVLQHFQNSPEVIRDAFELVVRRKALGVEGLVAQREALYGGRYPELEPKLQELHKLRMRIAKKILAGPGLESPAEHTREVSEWEDDRERLESELARRVPELNLERKLRSVDVESISLALPEDTCLVEFVRFRMYDFNASGKPLGENIRDARWQLSNRWSPARYVAFVLHGEPNDLQLIDLGEAALIERLVADFRSDIISGASRRVPPFAGWLLRTLASIHGKTICSPLRACVFDPLRAALGTRRRLLLVLDGDLSRLPFELLPLDRDTRLIDSFQISYIGCSRDLLRFDTMPVGHSVSEAIVIGDPDFELTNVALTTVPQSLASLGCNAQLRCNLERRKYRFHRLPGTRIESESVAAMLAVEAWLDEEALEGRLKKACRSPRILHIATHGFFLQDQPNEADKKDFRGFGLEGSRLSGVLPKNPMLRAGLAMAGAQTFLDGMDPPPEAEDGLLTAEDVAGLDLLGTELVVLSACETALGEARTREGVFGLQRAFTVAGAKTLVMSLWNVPDQPTRELMEEFYRRVLAGEGRAEALRNAQLKLRKTYPSPFYWGAFICQGNPAPLHNVTTT